MDKEGEAKRIGRVATAMVTPFDSEGNVDVDGVRRLASHLIEHGSDSLVVAGTTGESPNLDEHNRMVLLQTALKAVDRRGLVLAGTSTYSTRESVTYSKLAHEEGADGLLLVTPYYNKPGQEGLFRHFAKIAEATPDMPAILYNVPPRTNVNMLPDTVHRLDKEFENIVGLKEAVGAQTEVGRAQVVAVIAGKTPGFQVWSGNDQDTITIMDEGGFGIVSVGSHLVGDLVQRMVQHHVVGEREEARELHKHLMPLFEHLFPPTAPEASPSSVKTMLNIVGMNVGDVQLPLVNVGEVDPNFVERLQVLLASYELVPQEASVK